MNIHNATSTQTVSGSPRGHFGRNILIVSAAGLAFVAVAAGVFSSRSDRQEAASPAAQVPASISQSSGLVESASRSRAAIVPHTVYIVGSEQQASAVKKSIDEANSIVASLHEPFLFDEVVFAASNEDAAVAFAAQAAANEMILALYGVENRVVDLRR